MLRRLLDYLFSGAANQQQEVSSALLEEVKAQLKPLERPCIRITAIDTALPFSVDPLPLTASKFGGIPFLPAGESYPVLDNGDASQLLAQINFADVPAFPGFPADGLLQIFTKRAFEDFDVLPVVIYRPAADLEGATVPTATIALDAPQDYHFETVYELGFLPDVDLGSVWDAEFNKHLDAFRDQYSDDTLDLIYDSFDDGGHKLGGYASFTQEDPRDDGDPNGFSFLQIDSEDGIMIGDAGLIHVFLDPARIQPGRVIGARYFWDCS